MVPYTQSAEQTLQAQQSDIATGLSASQVKERLEKHGPNALQEKAPKTLFQRFLAQFKDVLIIILLISAAISLGVNIFSEEGEGFFEPILILVIVVLNACVGVFQENKAEKALDALKKMSSPQARVIRGGEEQLVDTD